MDRGSGLAHPFDTDEGMAKLVTFETPDGCKVCRAHAPLRSACLRHGASMSQSCRVMQAKFVLDDGECRGSLGVVNEEGSLNDLVTLHSSPPRPMSPH